MSNHERCEDTGKVEYSSKHDALQSLHGQLKSKSVRVYQCHVNPGHWHLTKESHDPLARSTVKRKRQGR